LDDVRRMVVRLTGYGRRAWEAAAQRPIGIYVPATTPADKLSAWNPASYREAGRRRYIPPDPDVQATNPIPQLRKPMRKRGRQSLISSWEQPIPIFSATIVRDQCGTRRVQPRRHQKIICARTQGQSPRSKVDMKSRQKISIHETALMRPVMLGRKFSIVLDL